MKKKSLGTKKLIESDLQDEQKKMITELEEKNKGLESKIDKKKEKLRDSKDELNFLKDQLLQKDELFKAQKVNFDHKFEQEREKYQLEKQKRCRTTRN